jgi:hypothetical protein
MLLCEYEGMKEALVVHYRLIYDPNGPFDVIHFATLAQIGYE